MFISRESDYAIRVIRTLANGEKKTINEISEAENITTQFAYKIARKLSKAGILAIYRGPKGGYSLAKTLNELTFYDVVSAIDEKLFITECMECGYTCSQNKAETPCLIHIEFCRIQRNLIADLKVKKISDIL